MAISLSREANAKKLILLSEGGVEVSVSEPNANGQREIVLDMATPETSTAVGLALISWLGRTSWDKNAGFEVPGEKKRKKKSRRR